MPATSLRWMKVNMLLMRHQERNADPMEKEIAKSAFLKPTNAKLAPQDK